MAKQSLRAIFAEVDRPRGGHKCMTCVALEELQGDDRAALVEWLGDRRFTAPLISEALNRFGLKVTRSSVQRHRRECPVQ